MAFSLVINIASRLQNVDIFLVHWWIMSSCAKIAQVSCFFPSLCGSKWLLWRLNSGGQSDVYMVIFIVDAGWQCSCQTRSGLQPLTSGHGYNQWHRHPPAIYQSVPTMGAGVVILSSNGIKDRFMPSFSKFLTFKVDVFLGKCQFLRECIPMRGVKQGGW